jgi:pyruvate-formate lyase-activating enzyme
VTHSRSELFCIKPFLSLEVLKWRMYLCCWTRLPISIGRSDCVPFGEVWNSGGALSIRESIHNGTFSYCTDECPFLSAPQAKRNAFDRVTNPALRAFLLTISNPVRRRELVVDSLARQLIDTRATVLPYRPSILNCAFDRSCNLRCPSCRTALIVEGGAEDVSLIEGIQRAIEEQLFPTVGTVYLSGSGDPFGSPHLKKWLTSFRSQRMPQLVNVHLHTNGQLWTRQAWERIPEEIRRRCRTTEISIDAATPRTYRANRPHGDYHRLLRNLEFISRLRSTGSIDYVKIHMVVQENNFMEMPQFVRLGMDFAFDTVQFSRLMDWSTFTRADLEQRQIHRREHALHSELEKILQHDMLRNPIVDLGNLTPPL